MYKLDLFILFTLKIVEVVWDNKCEVHSIVLNIQEYLVFLSLFY